MPLQHPDHIFVVIGHSIGAYLAVHALADVPSFPAAALFQVAPTLFGLGAQAGFKRIICNPYVSPWLGLAFGAVGWAPTIVRRYFPACVARVSPVLITAQGPAAPRRTASNLPPACPFIAVLSPSIAAFRFRRPDVPRAARAQRRSNGQRRVRAAQ
jgi:pimeloyl-ACP methyl ester carboxylesterase